ncbi:hypothetical protein ACQR1I_36355 [Bradyrhizobium sp. HKCCYLS2038]|uniref:hypothetical protein n=1 Tax=Bradyrhizobium sp. HKCCYLS2038 TaxID=3420764 RepID=UPI003EC01DDB
MADKSIGEVDTLIGTLRCSLTAAKAVSSMAGGYNGALARIGMLEFDTYVAIAAAGLGKKPSEVEAKVYSAGLVNLTAPFVEYVTYLGNGGKPVAEPANADGDAAAGEA